MKKEMEAIGPTFDIEGSPNDGANLIIFFRKNKIKFDTHPVRPD